jgi:nucleotide-binding universal stress UspA family protein
MSRFNKILYVVTQPEVCADTSALAMTLASEHQAELHVWAPLPAVPEQMKEYAAQFTNTVHQVLRQKVVESGNSVGSKVTPLISCDALGSIPSPVAIIQKVLREGFDLVIKAVDPLIHGGNKGFSALDLNLLRQCPCPVWLNRPHGKAVRKMVVAIDPNEQESAARELGLRLLRIAESLAQREHATGSIVSCWKLEHEYFLRSSPFGKLPASEVDALVESARGSHSAALQAMIASAGLKMDLPVVMLQGEPAVEIPKYLKDHDCDLLVMGTVARTGIPGFIIGNTAESIVQNVSCSMLAVKPQGFVSPVTL